MRIAAHLRPRPTDVRRSAATPSRRGARRRRCRRRRRRGSTATQSTGSPCAALRAALADLAVDGAWSSARARRTRRPCCIVGERVRHRRRPGRRPRGRPGRRHAARRGGPPGRDGGPRGGAARRVRRPRRGALHGEARDLGAGCPGSAPRRRDSSTALAASRGVAAADVRVAVQERPRNERFVAEARAAGASVELFEHGDVERCIRARAAPVAASTSSLGIGGAPEGVLTAAAVRALGGSMQARLAPQSRRRGGAHRGGGADRRPAVRARRAVRRGRAGCSSPR